MEPLTVDDKSESPSNQDQKPAISTKTGYYITKKLFFVFLAIIFILLIAAVLVTFFAKPDSCGKTSGAKAESSECEHSICKNIQSNAFFYSVFTK